VLCEASLVVDWGRLRLWMYEWMYRDVTLRFGDVRCMTAVYVNTFILDDLFLCSLF